MHVYKRAICTLALVYMQAVPNLIKFLHNNIRNLLIIKFNYIVNSVLQNFILYLPHLFGEIAHDNTPRAPLRHHGGIVRNAVFHTSGVRSCTTKSMWPV